MGISSGDAVTFEYTGRLVDGVVFDTSRESVAEETGLAEAHPDREYGPLSVEVGAGRIIDGLDEALVGMEEGEEKTVTIPPEKGYGLPSDDRIEEFDRETFDGMLQGEEPEEGMYVQTQQGALGEVVAIEDDLVRVDFNHELAGETLEFDIEIVSVG